ncbi:radical SAM domain-containing protein [Anopheles sinensis]|uniref:Radical SAM domain-containing protein n=1 Tax=Anopheles sinensis TaxID=74873 RepID=A0A084WQA0_ANOSI|nr:radical SAM domain-containing protein [Anopheles sinensis]
MIGYRAFYRSPISFHPVPSKGQEAKVVEKGGNATVFFPGWLLICAPLRAGRVEASVSKRKGKR